MMQSSAFPLVNAFGIEIDDIRRGNRGVEEVVTDLYAKLRTSLLSYVYHLVGSTRDAEDLVQVAFLQLFDQLKQGNDIQNVRGWLYRVVHNLAIEQARRHDRRGSLLHKWFADSSASATELVEPAEEDLIRREQIEKALEVLNERERHSLMLRAEGLSYQEIAEILEISAKSVSVYLARALKKFESRHENKT
jgi:RNA polymerase sigma-70 factor (ECF subfamily)